ALLRNLRNFEKAGVSAQVLRQVADRIADPEQVAKSRQFPYRFYSAYKATGSLTFAPALEAALEASVANIPTFDGRTLVAIDTSGSMSNPASGRSTVQMSHIAALFGAAVSARSDCDVIIYGDRWKRWNTMPSVLRPTESVDRSSGRLGPLRLRRGQLRFPWVAVERDAVGAPHHRVDRPFDRRGGPRHPDRAVGQPGIRPARSLRPGDRLHRHAGPPGPAPVARLLPPRSGAVVGPALVPHLCVGPAGLQHGQHRQHPRSLPLRRLHRHGVQDGGAPGARPERPVALGGVGARQHEFVRCPASAGHLTL